MNTEATTICSGTISYHITWDVPIPKVGLCQAYYIDDLPETSDGQSEPIERSTSWLIPPLSGTEERIRF